MRTSIGDVSARAGGASAIAHFHITPLILDFDYFSPRAAASYSTILPNNTTHTVHKKAIVSSIAHNPISSSSPNLLPSLSRSTPWTSSSTFHNTVLLRRVNNIPLVPLLGVNERYLFKKRWR